MGLYQNTILKKYREAYQEEIQKAYTDFSSYFLNADIQENIRQSKEEQFQEGFLYNLFVKVLGYTLNPNPNYNLITEKKNETNAKKADGAILVNNEVVGVIELKDTKTIDLKQVEAQAFGYKNNNRKAIYVVTSNFEKLRFYINNAVDYIEFNLFNIGLEEFATLWLSLAYTNIVKGLPVQIKNESVSSEDQITKQLYKEYSAFKRELFDDLVKRNPQYDKLVLFKKSQKLLDRFLFILFAEDSLLLPPNSIVEIVNQWVTLKELDAYTPLYDRLKKFFGYMNTGHKGKKHEIFAYNGGLFYPDEVLDNVEISDNVLHDYLLKISSYNFASEVDVNILGHIFENSLTEIEEVSKAIENNEDTAVVSKRKKDGVFYTPKYITTYIVENTLGKLCTDKKAELQIREEDYFTDKKRQKATSKKLLEKLDSYREWLKELTICDPACGSGAFLNAALDFLIREHKLIDEMTAKIHKSALVFADIENAILENNLYGVDINEESVEIAKLSLWLRTAKPHRKLNSLSDNIKCGNSLISDPEVAGNKAFDWEKEFPQVFAKGGFDVVIGNPPYVRPHNIKDNDKVYLWRKYSVASQKTDLYAFFTEKGMSLLKTDGLLGYIIPKTWMSIHSFLKMRELLLKMYNIVQIGVLPNKVFDDAIVETMILLVYNNKIADDIHYIDVYKDTLLKVDKKVNILINDNLNLNENQQHILSNVVKLGDITDIIVGIATGNDKKYCRFEKLSEMDKQAIRGANIGRYYINYTGEYIWYNREQMIIDGNNKPKSSLKQAVGQSSPKKPDDFELPEKIVMQRIAKKIIASIDTDQYYAHTSVVIIKPNESHKFSLTYLLSIINSKYTNYWLSTNSSNVSINVGTVKNIPIPNINILDQQLFIEKSDAMLSLNEELQNLRQRFVRRLTDNIEGIKINRALESFDQLEFKDFIKELAKQKIKLSLSAQDEWEEYFTEIKNKCNQLSDQITNTDKEIDQMVYKLYELTDEEIAIVEENN